MNKLLLGIAASAMLTTGALAHTPAPAPAAPAPAPTYNSAGFDWDGFYMGLGLTGIAFNPGGSTMGAIDIIAGVNVTTGNVLFGGEGWVGGYADSLGFTGVEAGIAGRLGYLVAPEVLIYLSAGGQFFDAGAQYGTVGGGVEFAVSDNVSIDVEYKYWGWSNNGFTGNSIGASANWGF
jgi:outer membrane immunogenic protein